MWNGAHSTFHIPYSIFIFLIMKSSPRQQHLLFLFVLMITGIIFLLRIRNLFPLYTNTQTRNAVKTAMTTVADREGWLLSDMLATNVTADEIRLTHRQHL